MIGPSADSARELLGDYSHVVHIQTLLEMRSAENAFGFKVTDEVTIDDELTGRRTIADAIRGRFPGAEVRHARGSGIRDGTDEEIAAAAATATWADVAIVCLGERSGLTDDATTGEFRDRRELGLIGRQQELLEAVVASGTPVVLVVVSGRPLAIEWAARHCAAILLAWVPGDEGPDAIVDVLTGAENPGGKLPVSIPRHVGQMPITYRHHPTGGRSQWKGDYVDGSPAPLWPFGFGRSYTSFELSNLRLDRRRAGDGRRPGRRSASTSPTSASGPATRSSSSTPGTRRRRSPGRSSSSSASAGSASRPASGGRCRSSSRPSSSPTPGSTTGGSSSPGPSGWPSGRRPPRCRCRPRWSWSDR